MARKTISLIIVTLVAVLLALPVSAAPGKPSFEGSVYADGELWGTKFTTVLPAPNGNEQSYDALVMVPGQMAVSEAGPGNPAYNGGRWAVYTATWLGEPYLLTSYAEVMAAVAAGDLHVEMGSPEGGPPPFFQCPLLPVK